MDTKETSAHYDPEDTSVLEHIVEEYLQRFQKRVNFYQVQARIYAFCHNTMQMIIAIGSGVTAFTVIYPDIPKIVPAIISSIVAISTVLTNYYKLGQISTEYQRIVDLMNDEFDYFRTRVKEYKDLSTKNA